MTLQRATWCTEAAEALADAARGDLDLIAAECAHQVSDLWRIGGRAEGWMVTRQEPGELVIVAAAGRNCRPVIRHVCARAHAAGLSVRTHIQRPGLRRIYEAQGFTLDELVMRRRPDGQPQQQQNG